uniref:protein kinase domain-containing protein n=1 Tax=Corallococcus coralloides TaxID=184914 RepID=UPI000FFEB8E8
MRGPLPPEQALRLGIQLAQGLAAAHARGVIHRDLKPANIFLCANGSARILDFGLARLTERIEDAALTQSGAVVGTAGYMAPEQIRGHGVDARADVFSLGALLHEAVSGRAPFDGDSPVERMSAALRDAPAVLPGELGTVIARCLAKAPEDRFQSAQDLAFALESIAARAAPLAVRRIAFPRPALWVAVAAVLLSVAGGLLAFGRMPVTQAVPTYRPVVTGRAGGVAGAPVLRRGPRQRDVGLDASGGRCAPGRARWRAGGSGWWAGTKAERRSTCAASRSPCRCPGST